MQDQLSLRGDQPTVQTALGSPVQDATGAGSPVIVQWAGREIYALRLALRMANEEFAEHLGVSVRSVAKWNTHPVYVAPGVPADHGHRPGTGIRPGSGSRSYWRQVKSHDTGTGVRRD